MLQNLFEAADRAGVRERINGNRMAFTYPFLEYRIWAADTSKKRYTALTGMDKASRTPAETDELRLCQKQLTRLKAIERCLHDLRAEGYQKETGQIASEQPSVQPSPPPGARTGQASGRRVGILLLSSSRRPLSLTCNHLGIFSGWPFPDLSTDMQK